jgi:hypothetical protein
MGSDTKNAISGFKPVVPVLRTSNDSPAFEAAT